MNRNQKGFTLVELMIVLVVIGIIAAFAIPNLMEAQKAGNETGAEKAMKTLVDAEANFKKADPDNDGSDFSYNLLNLHDQADVAGNKIAPIPLPLAQGAKEGYDYGACATYNAAGGVDPKFGFAYYAVPTQYATTGRRTYVVNHEGQIYYKDTGNNTVVAAWPDPANDATWIRLGE